MALGDATGTLLGDPGVSAQSAKQTIIWGVKTGPDFKLSIQIRAVVELSFFE